MEKTALSLSDSMFFAYSKKTRPFFVRLKSFVERLSSFVPSSVSSAFM